MDPSLPSVDQGQHQRSADYTATTGQIETDISGVLARSGAPWARKFDFLCFQEILLGENRPYVRDRDFLYWKNFSLFCPPEKPRDIAFIPSVLKRVHRWRVSWIRSINAIYVKDLKFNVEDCGGYIYSDVPHSTVKQMRKKKNSISSYNRKPHWALALVNGVRGPQRQG